MPEKLAESEGFPMAETVDQEREKRLAEIRERQDSRSEFLYGKDIQFLLETIDSLMAQQERVFELLEVSIWRHRNDFPADPYCVLCGVGRNWSVKHGHEKNCVLAGREIVMPEGGKK